MDENNMQLSPPGFHIIFQPFADELRKLDLPNPPKGPQDFFAPEKLGVAKVILASSLGIGSVG